MTKRKRAPRAPAQDNVEQAAPPEEGSASGDVAAEEVVPTSGTSTPRIADEVAEPTAPAKRKRSRRTPASSEDAGEPAPPEEQAETEAAPASGTAATEVVEAAAEADEPPVETKRKKATKARAPKKAARSADVVDDEATASDDEEPVPSGAVAANLLADAMEGSSDPPPIADEAFPESTGPLTFEIGADILGPDPLGDVEATINLSGDALPLPGRDDLDAPTVAVDGETLEAVDDAVLQRRHLRGLLEALIFASDSPIKLHDLAKLASASQKQVKDLLVELRKDYSERGIRLDEIAAGWTFRTSAQYAPFVRDLTKQKPVRLTRAQVETLAIIAYRQPITRPEIDDVRGVDSGPVLKLLLERDLVRILGKRDEVGRPLIYGTTNEFLEFFGLRSLKDLPTLREFTELTDESRETYEEEMGEPINEVPVPPPDDEGASGSEPPVPPAEASSPGSDRPLPNFDELGAEAEEGSVLPDDEPTVVSEPTSENEPRDDDDDLDEDDDEDDLDDEDDDDDLDDEDDDDDLDEDDDEPADDKKDDEPN